MRWDAKYLIGIDEIDQQHKTLIHYFTLLFDAIDSGGRWSDVHFPLLQLKDYAQMHFNVEESLLRMSDYPDTDAHIESHRKILRNLEEFEKLSLQKNITKKDGEFICDWIFGHIMKSDRDYAEHFAEGGRIIVRNTPSPQS